LCWHTPFASAEITDQDYTELTQTLSKDLPRFFYNEITQVIDNLVSLESKKTPEAPITPAFEEARATPGSALVADSAEDTQRAEEESERSNSLRASI